MITGNNHFWSGKTAVILGGLLLVAALVGGASAAVGKPAQIYNHFSLFGQETKLVAEDAQTSDFFGAAIAADGDTVVVGAQGEAGGEGDPLYHAGAAYIFERNAGGADNWGQVAKLTAGDPGFFDEFGQVVAISGDTVAVAAPFENGGEGNPLSDAGAVYIFERNQGGPNNWGQVAKVTPDDPGEEDDFGRALSLNGDTLAVASPGEDGGPGDPMSYAGAVYVFERNQDGPENWGQTKKLMSSDAQTGDGFGYAVAVSGDTLVAGAPTEAGGHGDPLPWSGAAYVFERNEGGAGNWGEVMKLTASDAQQNDRFGTSAAIDGDIIVVGAPFEDGGPGDPLFVAGAAYVFERNEGGPGNWGEKARLAAGDPDEGDFFADNLAVLGNMIVAGTPYESGGPGDPLLRAGAAYLFERDFGGPGNWGQSMKLMAGDAEPEDIFGSGTAVNSSGLIFVGALDGDVDGPPPVSDSGAAYVFNLAVEVDYSLYMPVAVKAE